jgi:hypothetical protein
MSKDAIFMGDSIRSYDEIDAMSSNEWLAYRRDLLETFNQRGGILRPTVGCSQCDTVNDYVCFDCECKQVREAL